MTRQIGKELIDRMRHMNDMGEADEHLRTMAPHQLERLPAIQLREAAAEIERMRLVIRRLAEQDATLSVCDGNVTVTMDGTLTDAEREAIERAIDSLDGVEDVSADATARETAAVATLRGLLERTAPVREETPPEPPEVADASPGRSGA